MRILALSDARHWNGYKLLVNRFKPAVIALAGDLTSDGHAHFWRTALEAIPGFRREKAGLRQRLGVVSDPDQGYDIIPRKSLDEYRESMQTLESRYRHTPAFLAARKRMHVDKFYDFLKYAGRLSIVLVVKGDHDDDFEGDYNAQRIDRIPGCREISGKVHTVRGSLFLGMGFEEAGYRRPLRGFIADYKGRVDVVIAHAPQKNVRLLAELRPRLLIRGHYAGGRHLIDGIPSVFTSAGHAIIETRRHGAPRICATDGEWWEKNLKRDYDWLLPYPSP